MPFDEREAIIQNLTMVDEVIDFDDDDKGSCCLALEKIKIQYPNDQIYPVVFQVKFSRFIVIWILRAIRIIVFHRNIFKPLSLNFMTPCQAPMP